ncbi:MAG: oligoribonuclease [Acidimicrobiales bacterium]
MLAWMDLEMTGLDPAHDAIIEIATLITDDDLSIIAEGPDLVVSCPPELLANMSSFVRDMHTRSGLLDAVRASTIPLGDAGATVLGFLKEHIFEKGTVPLAGNSIGTDRRFLAAHLPEVESWLHYRCVDVSTVKELCRRWFPADLSRSPDKKTSHRALEDIKESVAELAFYRDNIFRARKAPG